MVDGGRARLAESVSKRIAEFLRSGSDTMELVKEAVRRFQFLPLYLGWTAVLGVRVDGSLVIWEHEDEAQRDRVRDLDDPFLRGLAAAQGAIR